MEFDQSPSVQKPRLLIIDDDESIRSQMKWALIEEYEVLAAEDRPSALEVLRREHPTVATLDWVCRPNRPRRRKVSGPG